MSIKIGPGGFLDIVTSEVGPQRKVRLLSFNGRGDTGAIAHPMFREGENPRHILDVNDGADVTAFFGGVVYGAISQTDTGANDGRISGHTLLAVLADTGTAGL